MIEEAVIKAMEGHPRMGIMTERLKSNIEKFIADEFIIPNMQSNGRHNMSRAKTNPNITIQNKALLSDLKERRGSRSPPSPTSLSKYAMKRFNMSPKKKDSKTKEGLMKKSRTKSIY